jgi:hypothetical protein
MSATENGQIEPDATVELPEGTYHRVLYFAEQVLRREDITGDQNAMKGSAIIQKAKEEFEEAKNISDKTFSQYLSEAAKDPTSKINTRGKRKGYYLAEIIDEVPSEEIVSQEETDTKQGASSNKKENSQRSRLMDKDMKGSEENLDAKTIKILRKLQALGKKYGCGDPPEYTIQSHHQFRCKFADGTTREITVVVREEDISIFFRPNPPQWFEGNVKIEDVLNEVERLLESPN